MSVGRVVARCQRRVGLTTGWSSGGQSVVGIWHSQLLNLSDSPSSRRLKAGLCIVCLTLLHVKVLFAILAIVAGRALAGAYGSGFDQLGMSRRLAVRSWVVR